MVTLELFPIISLQQRYQHVIKQIIYFHGLLVMIHGRGVGNVCCVVGMFWDH